MRGGDQERLQPRHHGVAGVEEVVHLDTVGPGVRPLARRLAVGQDDGQRRAQQEEVTHVEVEVRGAELRLLALNYQCKPL